MKIVKISELKANLSANLRLVRAGEEVLISDREQPIARIVPIQTDGLDAREQILIAKRRATSVASASWHSQVCAKAGWGPHDLW
jgi:prevent-host-death family protein